MTRQEGVKRYMTNVINIIDFYYYLSYNLLRSVDMLFICSPGILAVEIRTFIAQESSQNVSIII